MLSLRDLVFLSCMFLIALKSGHGAEIIDGREVMPHSLPFMALLGDSKGKKCGGILINPKWVLTAAHCPKISQVFLGVHSIKSMGKEKKSIQTIKVQPKDLFPHPGYDNVKKINDLMLLKLKKSAKLTKTVKTLDLAKSVKDPAAGSSCMVAGWGATQNSGKGMSDVLMSVNVTVVGRKTCNSKNYYNFHPVITEGMICAGSDGKNKADSCQGDSGGPLLCNGVLTGITSFGIKCGLPYKPGVYSFLSEKQLIWIKKTMKKSEI